MAVKLKEYFPILKERETLLSEIQSKPDLKKLFEEWTEEQQKEFLDFCTGVRGIKFLYDGFFKEVMNPEYVPERLEEFLSLVLGKAVKILEILLNGSTRIADEMTLLIMDIVVQLEDGTIVNLEVQKIGYKQEYVCIPLDIYKESYQNENINIGKPKFKNKLEAWLAFLCMDEPEVVIRLIEEYPEFREMYEEAYMLCRNVDEVMQMFSKELAELDRNTVQLMIDEMQDEINEQKVMLKEKDARLEEQKHQLEQQECERKREVDKRMQMLRRVYAKLEDIEETAQLTGCSVEEVKEVMKV